MFIFIAFVFCICFFLSNSSKKLYLIFFKTLLFDFVCLSNIDDETILTNNDNRKKKIDNDKKKQKTKSKKFYFSRKMQILNCKFLLTIKTTKKKYKNRIQFLNLTS